MPGRERQGARRAAPLSAGAARAYLDVCFFHPFDDGNARSAFLALVFVLAREGVALDGVRLVQVRALQQIESHDDLLGLAERTVRDQQFLVPYPYRRRRRLGHHCHALQAPARGVVLLHPRIDVGPVAGVRVGLGVRADEHQVLHRQTSLRSFSIGTLVAIDGHRSGHFDEEFHGRPVAGSCGHRSRPSRWATPPGAGPASAP
ncbi:hypothetical protein ACF08N_16805 [Streptomyces sp. NPDC015127]|uniref:hypothetical protein n=1 Tax=Streptomyces sp. NPDC015127 TaxID=3364939 RepID=UPI0036FA099B